MRKPKLIFDSKGINFILEALGKKTDLLGYVLNEDGTYVLDIDGKPFDKKDILGIIKDKWITRESQLYMLIK